MEKIFERINFWLLGMRLPKEIEIIDIVQILLIAFAIYHLMLWVKNTRAYTLLKGVLVISVFMILAKIFHMDTILWIGQNFSLVAITAVLVIFQPELRRALEQLGEKRVFGPIFFDNKEVGNMFSDRTIDELVRACYEMGEVKTGALIVMEQNINLDEYIKTGIELDSVLSKQLLINIFEHNTPLHDGAIVVRGDRIVAATCYLPLSDNLALNKNLGTRHRAGVGISEVSDSMTIIVSEETGRVSYAIGGKLKTGVNPSELKEQLQLIQKKSAGTETQRFWLLKGRTKNE